MTTTLIPEARLAAGEIVSMDEGIPLPNYTGLVYTNLGGRAYVLWAYPPREDGTRSWAVINAGSVAVQSALDAFIKENTN